MPLLVDRHPGVRNASLDGDRKALSGGGAKVRDDAGHGDVLATATRVLKISPCSSKLACIRILHRVHGSSTIAPPRPSTNPIITFAYRDVTSSSHTAQDICPRRTAPHDNLHTSRTSTYIIARRAHEQGPSIFRAFDRISAARCEQHNVGAPRFSSCAAGHLHRVARWASAVAEIRPNRTQSSRPDLASLKSVDGISRSECTSAVTKSPPRCRARSSRRW